MKKWAGEFPPSALIIRMTKVVKNKNYSRLFLLCWFAYSMSYIGRLNFSVCIPAIAAQGFLTKAYLGTVGTGFLASYGAGQLLNGLLGDRISPKIMVGAGLLGAGIANMLMGLNTVPGLMIIIWCSNGLFQSMLWSPIIRALSEWLPKSRQARAGANISTAIPAGTITTYALSSFILSRGDWRRVFIIEGGLLIFASLVWFAGILAMRSFIAGHEGLNDDEDDSRVAAVLPAAGSKTYSMPALLLGTGLAFAVGAILFNGILKDGVTLWVPTFLSEFFKVEPKISAALSTILPIVGLTGSYAAVWINNKYTKNEMSTAAVLFLVSMLAIGGLLLFGRLNVILSTVFIAISLASMLGVNAMLLTFIPLHFSRLGKVASITGFLNSCSYLASAVSGVTIGAIAEKSGWRITIVSWLIIASLGMIICLAGKTFWARGRSKITAGWGYKKAGNGASPA